MDEPLLTFKWSKLDSMTDLAKYATRYGNRKAMLEMAESLRHKVNQYIPAGRTHKLQNKGYEEHAGTKGGTPYFTLQYRNTEEVPYVMYQYYGEIWGDNYAHWVPNLVRHKEYDIQGPVTKKRGKQIANQQRWQQIGWVSKKGVKKYNKHKAIGYPRSIDLGNGRRIYIKGYSKRKPRPQPKWLEWFRGQRKFSVWKDQEARQIATRITAYYQRKYGK